MDGDRVTTRSDSATLHVVNAVCPRSVENVMLSRVVGNAMGTSGAMGAAPLNTPAPNAMNSMDVSTPDVIRNWCASDVATPARRVTLGSRDVNPQVYLLPVEGGGKRRGGVDTAARGRAEA